MGFRVGQKVQFVTYKAPWYWWPIVSEIPRGSFQFGVNYIVAAVETRYCGVFTLLHFVGVRDHGTRCYPGWISFHFRAVVENKTEIGVAALKKIAADASRKPERVAAR